MTSDGNKHNRFDSNAKLNHIILTGLVLLLPYSAQLNIPDSSAAPAKLRTCSVLYFTDFIASVFSDIGLQDLVHASFDTNVSGQGHFIQQQELLCKLLF